MMVNEDGLNNGSDAFEVEFNGGPNGNRTRVSGERGQRPRPLDDGTV